MTNNTNEIIRECAVQLAAQKESIDGLVKQIDRFVEVMDRVEKQINEHSVQIARHEDRFRWLKWGLGSGGLVALVGLAVKLFLA